MSEAAGTSTDGASTPAAGSSRGNTTGGSNNLSTLSVDTDATAMDTRRPLRLRNPYPSSGTDIYLFEGSHPEIGVVLALRAERVKKKEQYEIFVRMLKDFVRVKFETGSDLDIAFDKLKSPLEGFNKFLPEEPSDNTNATLMEVMKEEVKLFAKRKYALTNNI
eukprot:CAMPEP_0195539572 /NCGR_PEP_ID=MMETSP0794_2-20130614/50125_1 /TAXON_ID=515487 /ORGANISM="Stephanopyxis turris, Strain CCMP 815" /LENGTH=162 /DNA_ID=CAMNT_0040673609 /DNA_START=281 /DNA_END=769 /DNA_ORIENTATION=+